MGLFLRAVGRKSIFLFGRLIAGINTNLHAKSKNNLSGKVCKIDKSTSLSVKTLKNMTPEKMENAFFFKFQILVTNIDLVSNFEKHLSGITVAEHPLKEAPYRSLGMSQPQVDELKVVRNKK